MHTAIRILDQPNGFVYHKAERKAERILEQLGISISAAHGMFYRQIIAHQGIPFDLRVPNADTLQAMRDARQGKGKKAISSKNPGLSASICG